METFCDKLSFSCVFYVCRSGGFPTRPVSDQHETHLFSVSYLKSAGLLSLFFITMKGLTEWFFSIQHIYIYTHNYTVWVIISLSNKQNLDILGPVCDLKIYTYAHIYVYFFLMCLTCIDEFLSCCRKCLFSSV